jgi:alanine racemase
MRPTKAVIHLDAILHNLSQIRRMAPASRIMAVVKADAYGHGIVPVARYLTGVDAFAVACIEEAIELREGGIDAPIVLLEGFFEANELPLIEQYQLQTVIHHWQQLKLLQTARIQQPMIVWLKLDSEMNRLGFAAEEYLLAYQQLRELPCVKEIRLMTHFACADDIQSPKTQQQLKLFGQLTAQLRGQRSAANSAAVLAWPESHFEWVRPGLMLYGCSPLADCTGDKHRLQPAMTLESRIISVKTVKAGQSVGYGAYWVAPRDTRLAIVAIGYGDGYPRHAVNGTPVWINGRLCPMAGRVSMDMIAVDLGAEAQDQVGDRVVLWGPELPVEIVAQHADTIPYTLLCGVTTRVKFEWRGKSSG